MKTFLVKKKPTYSTSSLESAIKLDVGFNFIVQYCNKTESSLNFYLLVIIRYRNNFFKKSFVQENVNKHFWFT